MSKAMRVVAGTQQEVMDIRAAAKYLNCSADALYKLANEKTIPAFRIGNRWRFSKTVLDRWMESQSSAAAPAVVGIDPGD